MPHLFVLYVTKTFQSQLFLVHAKVNGKKKVSSTIDVQFRLYRNWLFSLTVQSVLYSDYSMRKSCMTPLLCPIIELRWKLDRRYLLHNRHQCAAISQADQKVNFQRLQRKKPLWPVVILCKLILRLSQRTNKSILYKFKWSFSFEMIMEKS